MRDDNNHLNNNRTELSAEAITIALFEKYEGIYDIDVETSAYQCFFQNKLYSQLNIQESGNDFFSDLRKSVMNAHGMDISAMNGIGTANGMSAIQSFRKQKTSLKTRRCRKTFNRLIQTRHM